MTEQDLADFIRTNEFADSRGHLWTLYSICRAYAKMFGAINALEIGTRAGTSAIAMLAGLMAGNKDAKLISVDNDTDLDRDALRRAKERITQYGFDGNWEFYFADSRTWESPHEKYQVIFLDGDHSYEGIKGDFEKYSPMLAQHGVIAMHDAESFPGIRQWLPQLLDDRNWLTTVLPYYNGMAIARRRADWEAKMEYVEDNKW